MPYVIVCERISCDVCGYCGETEKFPNAEGDGVGTICPYCGNTTSFDFDPDDKIPRGCPELRHVL